MDTVKMLEGADELFSRGLGERACEYLDLSAIQAREEGDWQSELAALNELIGYCRCHDRSDDAWLYAGKAENVLAEARLSGTVAAATTQLNIASLFRATGNPREAMRLYGTVESIYRLSEVSDSRLAALYNNMCVTALDLEDVSTALSFGEKAAATLERLGDDGPDLATTYGNLSSICLKQSPPDRELAVQYIDKALALFSEAGIDNGHECALVASKAYLLYTAGNKEGAVEWYGRAMAKIEGHFGKTAEYRLMAKNKAKICRMLGRDVEAAAVEEDADLSS